MKKKEVRVFKNQKKEIFQLSGHLHWMTLAMDDLRRELDQLEKLGTTRNIHLLSMIKIAQAHIDIIRNKYKIGGLF